MTFKGILSRTFVSILSLRRLTSFDGILLAKRCTPLRIMRRIRVLSRNRIKVSEKLLQRVTSTNLNFYQLFRCIIPASNCLTINNQRMTNRGIRNNKLTNTIKTRGSRCLTFFCLRTSDVRHAINTVSLYRIFGFGRGTISLRGCFHICYDRGPPPAYGRAIGGLS